MLRIFSVVSLVPFLAGFGYAAPVTPVTAPANQVPAATLTAESPEDTEENATDGAAPDDASGAETERPYRLWAEAELGTLAVLSHRAQFGQNGTYFNYKSDGGQENLYFVTRWSLDLEMNERHHVVLLYQPLELVTDNLLDRDLVVDDALFLQGTAVRFTYGFPYYRGSYVYDVVDTPRHRLALGGSLQIRNANILFESLEGETFRENRDIGPVPLLKGVWEYRFDDFWIGSEIDGIYAPISYLNGSDNEIEGVFLDWSARIGVPLTDFADTFLNLRYLAGGAVGQSEDEPGPSDGYVKNWLKFATLTVGFRLGATD